MKIKRKADDIARLEHELLSSNIGVLSKAVKSRHSIKSKATKYEIDNKIDPIERDSSIARKKRDKKMKDLNAQQRIDLIHQVMIDKDRHSDVAEQYRVKDFVVHDLMKKVRQQKDYLRTFLEEEDQKEDVK